MKCSLQGESAAAASDGQPCRFVDGILHREASDQTDCMLKRRRIAVCHPEATPVLLVTGDCELLLRFVERISGEQ